MEITSLSKFFSGKRVFITGHTGFKGGWLAAWLKSMGAQITGYSLPPNTTPNLFESARIANDMTSIFGDVRDFNQLQKAISDSRPELLFHLAAQPLVRASYENPRETYETNVMGTVNVLESARTVPGIRVIINVTSDKCYENREQKTPYKETDPMGGFDPYSSSKGAAEIVASAFRRSFFNKTSGIALASVRAGNVIGGGDWSADRIIPDCVRALTEKKPIDVRNPKAVRPWQHVLEPLSGYILLASLLWKNPEEYDYGWNFGPFNDENHSVKEIVEQVIKTWGEGSWVDQSARSKQDHRHEAGLLDLDCSKARTILGWQPKYNTFQAVKKTVQWYKHFYSSGKRDAVSLVTEEISSYEAVLALT